MENDHNKKLSRLLSDLKKEYLITLPEKIEKLRSLTEKEKWIEIQEEYHKLKGTGKTYGFPEISTLSEQLETLAQKKESQKKGLFLEALDLLEEIRKAAVRNENYNLLNHPLGKTLLKSGRKK